MSQNRQYGVAFIAALLLLGLIGAASGSSDDVSKKRAVSETSPVATAAGASTTTATTTSTEEAAGPTRQEAEELADDGRLDEAIAIAVLLGDEELKRSYQRRAARTLERRARAALRNGDLSEARTLAKRARVKYGSAASEAPAIRRQVATKERARKARAAAKRRARAAAKAAARRKRQAQRLAAAQRKAASEQAAPSGNEYGGMTCDEIGHSFSVTPGSDPVHDRDGDGLACESQ